MMPLIESGRERGYVLFDEIETLLPEGFAGGRELDDLLLAIESTGVEILDEPKAEFEGRFRGYDKAYPVVHRGTRRMLVRRFPYAIFYRTYGDVAVVVACMHGSRDPRRWKSRT